MSSDDDMDARHGRMLAELADAGMALVRRLSEALQRVDGVQDLGLLGEAFHQVSRSVRQTIALEFKLRHAPREPAAPKPAPKPTATPPPERGDRPERTDWREYERADWDEPLDAVLGAGDRDAIDDAVDASIARIRRGLARAERTLTPCPTTPCHPGLGAAQDRDPDPMRSTTASGRRSSLLSTSSHRGPGLRVPRSRDDNGGLKVAPRPPPWRSSG